LNAYWKSGPNFSENNAECENVYVYHQTCVKLDKRREDGNELDEFEAHQLIEKVCDDALTVQKMREVLKEIDVDFNKRVSLCEFMIYKYGIDWKELVNAPQGCDMRAINEAQAALDNANAKLQDAIDAASKAKDDAHNSKIAEEKAREEEINSKKAAEDARVAEANLAEAKKQSEAALKELEDQEKAYKDKCDSLEAIGNDASLGVVKKNKAKAELAILKSEDPMPLRMAKIHQEAALRKVTKATVKVSRQIGRELCMRTGIEYRTLWVVLTHKKILLLLLTCLLNVLSAKAGAATAAAETAAKLAAEAKNAAEQAYVEAAAAAKVAEEAIPIAQQAFLDAETILEEVKKNNSGSGEGNIWYIDRELEERKKYLPRSRLASAEAAAAVAKTKLAEKKQNA